MNAMKTNNIMVRPMGQFKVEQRTKDGMFNATALLKQWNEYVLDTQNSGYVKKDLDDGVVSTEPIQDNLGRIQQANFVKGSRQA